MHSLYIRIHRIHYSYIIMINICPHAFGGQGSGNSHPPLYRLVLFQPNQYTQTSSIISKHIIAFCFKHYLHCALHFSALIKNKINSCGTQESGLNVSDYYSQTCKCKYTSCFVTHTFVIFDLSTFSRYAPMGLSPTTRSRVPRHSIAASRTWGFVSSNF